MGWDNPSAEPLKDIERMAEALKKVSGSIPNLVINIKEVADAFKKPKAQMPIVPVHVTYPRPPTLGGTMITPTMFEWAKKILLPRTNLVNRISSKGVVQWVETLEQWMRVTSVSEAVSLMCNDLSNHRQGHKWLVEQAVDFMNDEDVFDPSKVISAAQDLDRNFDTSGSSKFVSGGPVAVSGVMQSATTTSSPSFASQTHSQAWRDSGVLVAEKVPAGIEPRWELRVEHTPAGDVVYAVTDDHVELVEFGVNRDQAQAATVVTITSRWWDTFSRGNARAMIDDQIVSGLPDDVVIQRLPTGSGRIVLVTLAMLKAYNRLMNQTVIAKSADGINKRIRSA